MRRRIIVETLFPSFSMDVDEVGAFVVVVVIFSAGLEGGGVSTVVLIGQRET